MLRIKQHDTKLLDCARTELWNQERRHPARRRESSPWRHVPDECPSPEFDGRNDLAGPGHADPGQLSQLVRRTSGQAACPAGRGQNGVGEIQTRRRARPLAEHERQQLVVAQPLRTETVEFLPRTVVWRDCLHTVCAGLTR